MINSMEELCHFLTRAMGCFQSKEHAEETATNNPQKQYSWDTREKVNPADFTLEKIKGQEIGKHPGSINGQQMIIQNCQECRIYLFDHINTITIDDCSDCYIFIGPTAGSLFIRDCHNCTIMAACGQFRTRDCSKLDVFLFCQTQPIIETSTKMKFGCFQAYYPKLKVHFDKCNLSVFNNNWSNVHDFTPVEGEKNWGCLAKGSNAMVTFPVPQTEEFGSVGLSLEPDLSVVPYTGGSADCYDVDNASLVTFFCDDIAAGRVKEFMCRLRKAAPNCTIQHSREVKMDASDAMRVFLTDDFKSIVERGPVIALLCNGNDALAASNEVVEAMFANESVKMMYVTDDPNTCCRQIDAFFSYASMTMSV